MKKFFALILSLVCIFVIAFTACADVGNQAEGQNGEQHNENRQESDEAPEEEEDGNAEKDDKVENPQEPEQTEQIPNSNYSQPEEAPENNGNQTEQIPSGNDSQKAVYGVGDKLPDFTVVTYQSAYKKGTFSSVDARGKALVINFWFTNCGYCVEEMPSIEQTKKEFGDDVVVLALHACDSSQPFAQTFIDSTNQSYKNKTPWSDYQIIFGKDLSGDQLFKKCGGTTFYPITVVLDREGVITSVIKGSILRSNAWGSTYTNVLTPAVRDALQSGK